MIALQRLQLYKAELKAQTFSKTFPLDDSCYNLTTHPPSDFAVLSIEILNCAVFYALSSQYYEVMNTIESSELFLKAIFTLTPPPGQSSLPLNYLEVQLHASKKVTPLTIKSHSFLCVFLRFPYSCLDCIEAERVLGVTFIILHNIP